MTLLSQSLILSSLLAAAPSTLAAQKAPAAPAKEAEVVDERPGIAIAPIKTVGSIDWSLAELLEEVFLTALRESNQFSNVLGGPDLKAAMDYEQQRSVLGCEDESCLQEFGSALGVPLLAQLTVGVIAGEYIVNLKIFDVDEAQSVFGGMRREQEESKLVNHVRSLATEAAEQVTKDSSAPSVSAMGQRSRVLLWVGGVAAVAGAAGLVGGLFRSSEAQALFDRTAKEPNYDEAAVDAAEAAAIRLWVGGIVGLTAGVGLITYGMFAP